MVIALSSIVQIGIAFWNDISTSRQVDKIISAAGSIQDSANQIKSAGWVFSGAAQGINNAGWNAVGKLQGQVDQVKRSADATMSAANTASASLATGNRPWVGINGNIGITGGSIHNNPYAIRFWYKIKNVGASMAFNVRTLIWAEGGDEKGIALMDSHHCEDQAGWLRKDIALREDFDKHRGHYPKGIDPVSGRTGTSLLPGGIEDASDLSQESFNSPPAPTQPEENVYVLFCTVYADQFKTVHLTQNMFCYLSRSPQLRDTPSFCGGGDYAY